MPSKLVVLIFVLMATGGIGKIYERCELAREIRYRHNIPMEQVGDWVCNAEFASKLNTSDRTEVHRGIFLIHTAWCGPGGECNLDCEKLLDDDISDDIFCMQRLLAQHGYFSTWEHWTDWCPEITSVQSCFATTASTLTTPQPQTTATQFPWLLQTTTIRPQKTRKTSQLCQLASDMQDKYNIPDNQVSDQVCHGQYASEFITSAVAYDWGRGMFSSGKGCQWYLKVALSFCFI